MAVAARQVAAPGIEVRPVHDKKEVEVFLHVPWTLGMKEDPNWVPPLLDDYRRQLDAKKSPFLKHGELACFTAFEAGTPVGRISVQIDREFDRVHPQEPGVAFFGFFDCPDRLDVARALFAQAEEWALAKGRTRLRGPFTLDTKGEVGVLVEGFEAPPRIGMASTSRTWGASSRPQATPRPRTSTPGGTPPVTSTSAPSEWRRRPRRSRA